MIPSRAAGQPEETKTYKVAIIKQLDHASLDEIANAVAAELDKISADNGVTITYDITSGQNDQSTLKQLSDQAIADGVDAIIPIATTAAQIAALSAEETKTPVIYAAVSDPEAASLTGIDYVTGTSDALNTEFIMDMMFTQDPAISKVGLLYSLSEPNSTSPLPTPRPIWTPRALRTLSRPPTPTTKWWPHIRPHCRRCGHRVHAHR